MRTVYFARAMDGLSRSDILLNYAEVDEVLGQIGLHLTNPYQEETYFYEPERGAHTKEEAHRVVQGGLERLRQADMLLVDLSIPRHTYIGCICEMVYACLWGKPVVVYVGNSGNESRPWLQYHATHICTTFGQAVSWIAHMSKRK